MRVLELGNGNGPYIKDFTVEMNEKRFLKNYLYLAPRSLVHKVSFVNYRSGYKLSKNHNFILFDLVMINSETSIKWTPSGPSQVSA